MKKSYPKIIKTIALSLAGLVYFLSISNFAYASPITEENVLNLINNERTERGINPLRLDSDLDQAALNKSKDMLHRNYFEHFAFGLKPWDFISLAGYNYLYAGENLAMKFETSEGMVNAWMNSPKHRDNILSPEFEDIGIGIVKGEFVEADGSRDQTTIVTNMFGRKKPIILQVFNRIIENIHIFF